MSPANSIDVFRRLRAASPNIPIMNEEVNPEPPIRHFPKSKPSLREQVWIILDAKMRRFTFRAEEGAAHSFVTEVEGVFNGVYLSWFGGQEDKAPCYCACLDLTSEEGEPRLVKVGSATAYYMLAAQLQAVKAGDIIHVTAKELRRSCGLDLFIARGDGWRLPPRMQFEGCETVEEKVLQGTKRFFAHAGYLTQFETPGPDGGVKAYRRGNLKTLAGPEPQPPVRQTHAQIPNDFKPLRFAPYMELLGADEDQVQVMVDVCRGKRLLAGVVARACQRAGCRTFDEALEFVCSLKEEIAA